MAFVGETALDGIPVAGPAHRTQSVLVDPNGTQTFVIALFDPSERIYTGERSDHGFAC
jgi:hypothetical protein